MKNNTDDTKYPFHKEKVWRSILLTHVPLLLVLLYKYWIQRDLFSTAKTLNSIGICGLFGSGVYWDILYADNNHTDVSPHPGVLRIPRRLADEPELNTWYCIFRKWLFTVIIGFILFWVVILYRMTGLR